jgi:hypothetical protein
MNRYQCIKTVTVPSWLDFNSYVAFKAGIVYPFIESDDGFEVIDNEGITHIVTNELMQHFKDLPPLDLPRDEAYPEPFTTPEPRRKLTAGWAWFIVLMTTLTAIILSEIL